MSDTFYIDPVVEAQKYGIDVFTDTDFKILEPEYSGMIVKDDNSVSIYVSPSDSFQRKRFTVAHELGHFVNGHLDNDTKMLRDSSKSYTKDTYDFREYEANKYAAELLMPESKLEFLLNDKGVTTVDGLAEALVVSVSAMTIRLKNLGWIS